MYAPGWGPQGEDLPPEEQLSVVQPANMHIELSNAGRLKRLCNSYRLLDLLSKPLVDVQITVSQPLQHVQKHMSNKSQPTLEIIHVTFDDGHGLKRSWIAKCMYV